MALPLQQQALFLLSARIRTARQFEAFVEARMPGGTGPYDGTLLRDRIKGFIDFKIRDDAKNAPPDVRFMGPMGRMMSEQYTSLLMMVYELLRICRNKQLPIPRADDFQWLTLERDVYEHCRTKCTDHGLPPATQQEMQADLVLNVTQMDKMEKAFQPMKAMLDAAEPTVRAQVYGERLPDFSL